MVMLVLKDLWFVGAIKFSPALSSFTGDIVNVWAESQISRHAGLPYVFLCGFTGCCGLVLAPLHRNFWRTKRLIV